MKGRTSQEKLGLLETLHESVGCTSLSDLRAENLRDMVLRAMHSLHTYDFSLDEWNDAVQYLSHKKSNFDKAEFARSFLEKFLLGEKDWI